MRKKIIAMVIVVLLIQMLTCSGWAMAAGIETEQISVSVREQQNGIITDDKASITVIRQGKNCWYALSDLNSITGYNIEVQYVEALPEDADWYNSSKKNAIKDNVIYSIPSAKNGSVYNSEDNKTFLGGSLARTIYPMQQTDRGPVFWKNAGVSTVNTLTVPQAYAFNKGLFQIMISAPDMFEADIEKLMCVSELRTCSRDDGTAGYVTSVSKKMYLDETFLRLSVTPASIAFLLQHELTHIQQITEGRPTSETEANFEAGLLLYRISGIEAMEAKYRSYKDSSAAHAQEYAYGLRKAIDYMRVAEANAAS